MAEELSKKIHAEPRRIAFLDADADAARTVSEGNPLPVTADLANPVTVSASELNQLVEDTREIKTLLTSILWHVKEMTL